MTSQALDALEANGWFATSTETEGELLSLAGYLGTPAPSRVGGKLIDELKPTPASQAKPSSLSANHGVGAFPLHTDTAYWRTPARYILLRAAHETVEKRPTLLLDTRALDWGEGIRSLLKRAVFIVRNGRSSFLAPILAENDRFLRFDRDCMLVRSESAKVALTLVATSIAEATPSEFYWGRYSTLVLDNWRFLHGRSTSVSTHPEHRCIQRILVTAPK